MAKARRTTKKVETVEDLQNQIQELELQKQLIDLDIQKLKLKVKFLEKKNGQPAQK